MGLLYAASADNRDGSDELPHFEMANPQAAIDSYVTALYNDPYGKAMKHYLATKEWQSDPKI